MIQCTVHPQVSKCRLLIRYVICLDTVTKFHRHYGKSMHSTSGKPKLHNCTKYYCLKVKNAQEVSLALNHVKPVFHVSTSCAQGDYVLRGSYHSALFWGTCPVSTRTFSLLSEHCLKVTYIDLYIVMCFEIK